jgi:hypothetical protein
MTYNVEIKLTAYKACPEDRGIFPPEGTTITLEADTTAQEDLEAALIEQYNVTDPTTFQLTVL